MHDNWVAYFRTWRRRSLFSGRALTCRSRSNGVKFTKGIAHHTEIRDQNPSLGYICPGEPHERSPNAPKFEDRSQEETEWQEQGAREAAWKLAKNVFTTLLPRIHNKKAWKSLACRVQPFACSPNAFQCRILKYSMRGLLQPWTRSSIIPISKGRSVWRNKRPRKRTVSFAADRLPTWSTIISGSLEPMILSKITPTCSLLSFEMTIFRNSIQSGTECCCLWRKSRLMTSWKDCTNGTWTSLVCVSSPKCVYMCVKRCPSQTPNAFLCVSPNAFICVSPNAFICVSPPNAWRNGARFARLPLLASLARFLTV